MNILIIHGPNLNLLGLWSATRGKTVTLDKVNRHIRRYIRDKGYLDFISAANYFKSSNRFKFLSYGDIDLANPSSLSSNEINFLMNNSNVDIFDYQSDLDLLYSSVDLVIIPSYREGLPRVLIEASSFGKAIIASDAPGCSECVHDGYNGYIFSVGNILDLVYTIYLIASDISFLNTMKVNSTKIASRYFLIDNIVSDYLRVYNEL